MNKKLLFFALVIGISIFPADTKNLDAEEVDGFSAFTSLFVDPLPIPSRLVVPANQSDITVRLTQVSTQLYKSFTAQTLRWGYNGSSPGPTIEVERGQKVRVHWKNELSTQHVLPAPQGMMNDGPAIGDRVVLDGPSMPGMTMGDNSSTLPQVRNVTHLHGAAVWEPDPMNRHFNSDGWPDAWNVPGEEQIAEYPNVQDARTLWYHDHAIGETGRNVAAGLLGMYIIHDGFERGLNLPSGKYEIPLIFQTMGVKPNGSIFYTEEIDNEFYGNAVAVNGKILPYLEVEPRKYRFRMLNGSNARMLGLKLADFANRQTPGPGFYQIGTDSGFLEKTVLLNDPNDPQAPQLFLASGERADVIIDFSKYSGRSFILTNTHSNTDPDGEINIPQIMLFKVGTQVSEEDKSSLPNYIRHIERLKPEDTVQTRKIILSEIDNPDGSTCFQLDKRPWFYKKKDQNGTYWDYAIDKKPVLGTSEVWELVNTTAMIHPFHIHLVDFQVLDRRPFDVDQYSKTGKVAYTGPAVLPDANEMGFKDVVRSNPGEVTRIIMRFLPYPGYFVYHCHILEHEDMDMMIPFQVVSPLGN